MKTVRAVTDDPFGLRHALFSLQSLYLLKSVGVAYVNAHRHLPLKCVQRDLRRYVQHLFFQQVQLNSLKCSFILYCHRKQKSGQS